MRRDPDERFDGHWRDDFDGCWLWQAARDRDGYGLFKLSGRMVRAHRYAYEREHGPISRGLQLDHLCGNRSCVNPAHLEAVTPAVNTLRSRNRAAQNVRKTECLQGHPFTPANTLLRADGSRGCRACQPRFKRQFRERQQLDPRYPHGTLSRYNEAGCRCAECRKASADYQRDHKRRKREAS